MDRLKINSLKQLKTIIRELKPIKAEGKTVVFDNGIEFRVDLKVLTPFKDRDRYIQAVAYLYYNNQCVFSWGCESAEESYDIAWFHRQLREQSFQHESEIRDRAISEAKELLNL